MLSYLGLKIIINRGADVQNLSIEQKRNQSEFCNYYVVWKKAKQQLDNLTKLLITAIAETYIFEVEHHPKVSKKISN